MLFLKIAALAAVCVSLLCQLVIAVKSGKPFKNLAVGAVCGIIGLAAVDLTVRFTGIHIPVNPFTVSSSALFGLPAVCGLVLLQLIF